MNLIKLHPAVYILYYILWLVFLFMFNNPFYIIASYVAIIALICLQGIRNEFKNSIKMVIPMAVLIFILNPILYHEGAHRIYLIGSFFITVEATFYGCIMAATLLLVLLLFSSYNASVSYQEMLYIFSKKFSNLSMVMVMALRFIPLLNSRTIELSEVNKLNSDDLSNFDNLEKLNNLSDSIDNLKSKVKKSKDGSADLEDAEDKLSFGDKVKNTVSVFAIVISWSLEESMLTAKSMKARAYGVAKRTNYLKFDLNLIDYVLFALIIISFVVSVLGLSAGYGRIDIYPVIKFSFTELPLNIYFLAFVVFLCPLIILEIYEKYLWYKHDKKKLCRYNVNIVNEIATPDLSNLGDGSEKIIAQTEMCFNIGDSNISKLKFSD